jgi:cerevisin
MRGLLTLSFAAYAAAAPALSHESIHGDAAPILSSVNAETIPNSYIIKFKEHVTASSASDHQTWIQKIHSAREGERLELRKRSQIPMVDDVFRGLKHTYKIGSGFLGYAGHFDDETIEEVRRHPDVSSFPFPSHETPGHPTCMLDSNMLSALLGTSVMHTATQNAQTD